jgi:hypothetical protein
MQEFPVEKCFEVGRENMKTRNKFSVGTAGFVLLLALILAGCQDVISDFTLTKKGPDIGSPVIATPKKVIGGVLLSWEVVEGATGYSLYRKNNSTGEEKKLTLQNDFYHLDLVDWDNPLAAGSYTYKVVASNSASVEDGIDTASTVGVTFAAADFPARTAADNTSWIKIETPTVEDLADGAKRVVVKTEPNLTYDVKVALGGAAEGVFSYLDNSYNSFVAYPSSSNPFISEKVIILPPMGGTSTVEITASYRGGNYYPTTTVLQTAVTQADAGDLAQPDSFRVSRGAEPQYVNFSWDNVPGATGYKIYKAEVENWNSYSVYWPTGTLKSGWTAVTLSVAPQQLQDTTWIARETDAAGVGKGYVYIVVADAGTTKKSPASDIAYVTAEATPTPSITAIVDPNSANAVSPKIQLTWTAEAGATYTLARAEATWPAGSASLADVVSAATFTPIALIDTDYQQGRGVKIDQPAVRKSYIYRLVATKNGVASAPDYDWINEGAFSYKTDLSASANNDYHGIVAIDLNDNATYWTDNPVIKVYRKEANAPQTAYKDQGTATYSGSGSIYKDTTAVIGVQYQYKFVVTKGSVEFENTNGNGTVYATAENGNVYYVSLFAAGPASATATTRSVRLSFNGSHLEGMPIRIEYKAQSAASWTTINAAQDIVAYDPEYSEYAIAIGSLTPNTIYQFAVIRGNWTNASLDNYYINNVYDSDYSTSSYGSYPYGIGGTSPSPVEIRTEN